MMAGKAWQWAALSSAVEADGVICYWHLSGSGSKPILQHSRSAPTPLTYFLPLAPILFQNRITVWGPNMKHKSLWSHFTPDLLTQTKRKKATEDR